MRRDGQLRGPEHRRDGRLCGRERCRGTWWHRVEQRELKVGVDFVQDTEGASDEEVEFIPASDDEGGLAGLDSAVENDKDVLETEPQELVAMDSGGMVTASFGVDPDAETDDESIKMEIKRTTNKITSDNHAQSQDDDFEDFKLKWMKIFYPEWAHPTLDALKRKRN